MAPSPTIRRLLKETSELSSTSKNPNPAFHAAPVSEADLHEWHFTLLGPPSPSPYAGGLYHGRISLPPSYPLKPPNFRFLTPSGRFEVNREICLSISGFHEETWMPAWGVRTALTALRSFMAESGTAGQVGGLEAPKEVRERLARESRTWRCAECGARSNEEIMSDWWEACAAKGVKVGEDVGLEVLPEGLSLEAKIPQAADGSKRTAKDEMNQGEAGDATTRALLHNRNQGHKSSDTTHSVASPPALSVHAEPGPLPTPTLPENQKLPSPPSTALSVVHQSLDSQPHIQTPNHQQQAAAASGPPLRPNPSNLRQIPLVDPSPPATAAPLNHRRDEIDTNTVTIDRAIYVVFVALLLMCVKKIFYPAGNNVQWEDYAMVRA